MAVSTNKELVRITFYLNPEENQGFATESLWAESLGHSRYRLRNSPFYVYGVSNEDIVLCKEEDGGQIFQRVLIRGNHSTYRLKLSNGTIHDPSFLECWKPIAKLGCTFEEGPVLSVDVPPDTDIYAAYELFEAGESRGVWEFEESHCGHQVERSKLPP